MSKRYFILPDCQIKPGQDTTWLRKVGEYCVSQKPDVLVCLGDFYDMPSLSSYDTGKRVFEGRRYTEDIDAGRRAMGEFLAPIREEQARLKRNKEKLWKPQMVFLLGNHEQRIERATNNDPKLTGLMSYEDLQLERFGWDVKDFLSVVVLDGIAFSHYFGSGAMGRPIGTSGAMVNKLHMSAIAGHQQGRQVSYGRKADGSHFTCIIAGSCYPHDEDYLGHQGNAHWRGVIILNEVNNGRFDECFVSLKYILER